MSEVRLIVREAQRDWSGTIHGSCADRAVAALSADPMTLEELETAVVAFAKPAFDGRYFSNLRPGLDDEPYDAGLVVIDLAARLVTVDSSYSSPGRTGAVPYHDGRCCTDTYLRYRLADDWLFTSDGLHWRAVADARRREQAERSPRDVRAVIYGPSMLEFIARETFAAFARRDEIAAAVRAKRRENARRRLAEEDGVSPEDVDPSRLTDDEIAPHTWPGQERYANLFYDTLKDIHAAWLLTPCEDLDGGCPREALVERHDHVSWNLQHRSEWWSALGQCPPGLDESSWAFHYGGFGTHELVMYYNLVRELLWSCWERLTETSQSPESSNSLKMLTAGDFLAAEIPRLERVRDEWLDTPDLEFHGRTPRSIIHRERIRLPEAVSPHEAVIDPDCPCCQWAAEMPGPMFWGLDGCNMDDEFAFNFHHRTREEWEKEQREWEEHNRRFDAEWKEKMRLGVADRADGEGRDQSIWSSSFCVGDTADVPLGIRVFGIGCCLAELIVALRDDAGRGSADSTEQAETGRPEALQDEGGAVAFPPAPPAVPAEIQQLIDQLNRDFGNLREILQTTEPSLAEALIEPVLNRFTETLAGVATSHPRLSPQCESLTEKLTRLLDPPPPEPPVDFLDDELPF